MQASFPVHVTYSLTTSLKTLSAMAQAQNGLAILLQFYETHRSFRIDFNDLRNMRLIANGGFSDVYSAQFSNGDQQTVVACKELRVMLPHDQVDSENEYKVCTIFLYF